MLILSENTDKIQAVLGGSVTTNQLRCVTSWRDVTTTTYVPGRTLILTNNATDVDIVGSPGSSTQRIIDFVSIYNFDTVTQMVTVKFDANGTDYIIWKGNLATGERLEYIDGKGFSVFTAIGGQKTEQTVGLPIATDMAAVVLGADVINNNAVANTLQNVTGLLFPVVADNTYYFEAIIPYTAAATTTGSRWTINGPAVTMLNYTSEYTLTATTKTVNCATAYQIPAASSATSLTTGNISTIWGIIKPSANGDVQIQFASEISASAITAKAGSILRYRQLL